MNYFALPADFKQETLDRYEEINKKQLSKAKIFETYGQLAPNTFLGSGRNPKNLPKVDLDLLKKYVEYSHEKGIEFNYVINATTLANEELTEKGFKKIKEFLLLLQDIGVNWITLSLPSLMEIAKEVVPNIKIKASTLCQINSPTKAEFYERLGIERIVLDEDIHRRFDSLKNIRKVYSGDIEVIVNSYCINDCPYKMFHFNSYSHTHLNTDFYSYFESRCMASHIGEENYMKLNWIRPEDIHYYSEIGINYFKLQGRTNVYSGDPVKAVKHYIDQYYDGDFISLLELFSKTKPFTISGATINNRQLDGFLSKFVDNPKFCQKVCSECGYCNTFAKRSINSSYKLLTDEMIRELILEEFPRNININKP